MMEKLILKLLQNDKLTEELLKKYNFYIVPMINIDGVIMGNYRTNRHGLDLNRTYHDPSITTSPSIFYYKNFMKDLKE